MDIKKCRDVVRLAFNSFEPVYGAEQVTPILFLHAVIASKENWGDIPQLIANATGRKTYALDFRNHGDSEWTDAFDFQINVDDLIFFLDNMHIKKAILVGHSMGGIAAIKTALRAPERVEKLVVEEMTVKPRNQKLVNNTVLFLELILATLKAIPANLSLDEAVQFTEDYIYNNTPQKFKPYILRRCNELKLTLKQVPGGKYSYKTNYNLLLKKLKDANALLTPYEGTYKGPTLFIYGEKSPFKIGQDKDFLKEIFPNAEMLEIKEAQHTVHEDFPLKFTEALLLFLEEGWNRNKSINIYHKNINFDNQKKVNVFSLVVLSFVIISLFVKFLSHYSLR